MASLTKDELIVLKEYGLVPIRDVDAKTASVMKGRRPAFALDFDWDDVVKTSKSYPELLDYMFLSSGPEPVMFFNIDRLSFMDGSILLFSDEEKLMLQLHSQIDMWNRNDKSLEDIMKSDFDRYVEELERAVVCAPTRYKELVFMLAPFDTDNEKSMKNLRSIGLLARKEEEYPSYPFDSELASVLRNVKETTWLERSVDGPLELYRGEGEKSVHGGMSWTTSKEVAEKFARRFERYEKEPGTIYRCTVEKDEILAAYGEDPEFEVLVDPESGAIDRAKATKLTSK